MSTTRTPGSTPWRSIRAALIADLDRDRTSTNCQDSGHQPCSRQAPRARLRVHARRSYCRRPAQGRGAWTVSGSSSNPIRERAPDAGRSHQARAHRCGLRRADAWSLRIPEQMQMLGRSGAVQPSVRQMRRMTCCVGTAVLPVGWLHVRADHDRTKKKPAGTIRFPLNPHHTLRGRLIPVPRHPAT